MAEKKKYDSDIVGWITRGGKRIPIREGEKKSSNNYRTNRHGKPYEDEKRGGDGTWAVNRHGKPYKKNAK